MQSHFLLRYALCDFLILQDLYILMYFADLIKKTPVPYSRNVPFCSIAQQATPRQLTSSLLILIPLFIVT